MANISVYNMKGEEVGSMDLNDAVFGVDVNEHLIHLSVVAQLKAKRQGTQKAKTRSEVRGGGKKPWRQKGTGHARQGSIRAPQWAGGGVVFAPTPRDYSVKLNKKEKKAAMRSALTSRVQENKLIVLDDLSLSEIKTKKMQEVLDALNVDKALIILPQIDENVMLSTRNIPDTRTSFVKVVNGEDGTREVFSNISVYDIMKYSTVITTKAAVESIEEVYA